MMEAVPAQACNGRDFHTVPRLPLVQQGEGRKLMGDGAMGGSVP